MSLRKRIEHSQTLAAVIAAVAGWYLSWCSKRTDWTSEGLDDLHDALANGPVLLVMWHSRCLMAAEHWPVKDGPLSSLYNRSPVGRLAGALHRRAGLQPMQMSKSRSNRSASRKVLRRVKDGVSIGMTGDGPTGPALQVQPAVLEWARVTGMPIFAYAYSTARQKRMSSWDKMLVPKSGGRGAFVFRRFEGAVPRKMSPEETEYWRDRLKTFFDETTHDADRLAGTSAAP